MGLRLRFDELQRVTKPLIHNYKHKQIQFVNTFCKNISTLTVLVSKKIPKGELGDKQGEWQSAELIIPHEAQ